MPKNIVVLSDGTGQEGGKGNDTNIYKFIKMLGADNSKQIHFYDPGVGTNWRKFLGMTSGRGFANNILECYDFLSKNYEKDDNIFLIGFSRGAATVRSLSGFVNLFGILSTPELIKEAWDIYKTTNRNKQGTKIQEFHSKHNNKRVSIRFLGCYDTVAALGHPLKFMSKIIDKFSFWKHRFHDFSLVDAVEYAYQALSIDDERKTFHPALWNDKYLPHQTVKQVWFCGMHTDVGGGYAKYELSNIPFSWMINMAKNAGLIIDNSIFNPTNGDANGHMHDSMTWWYRKKRRFWDSSRADKPIIHESVLERTKGKTNKDAPPYKPWILNSNLNYEVER